MITEMDTDGANGIGKLKYCPHPMGNICKPIGKWRKTRRAPAEAVAM